MCVTYHVEYYNSHFPFFTSNLPFRIFRNERFKFNSFQFTECGIYDLDRLNHMQSDIFDEDILKGACLFINKPFPFNLFWKIWIFHMVWIFFRKQYGKLFRFFSLVPVVETNTIPYLVPT